MVQGDVVGAVTGRRHRLEAADRRLDALPQRFGLDRLRSTPASVAVTGELGRVPQRVEQRLGREHVGAALGQTGCQADVVLVGVRQQDGRDLVVDLGEQLVGAVGGPASTSTVPTR